jgi:acyl-CoA reductase-like NAD-dependent aldehyde dehydrogenase
VSAQRLESFSPQAPRELVGEFAISSPEEVGRIVARAREAQRQWWTAGAAGRAAAMMASAAELRARRDEFVALVVREVGKPAVEARRSRACDLDPRVLRAGVLRGGR